MEIEELEAKFDDIKDIIRQSEENYHTSNGINFKHGMIFMYNLFVNRILGNEDLLYEK